VEHCLVWKDLLVWLRKEAGLLNVLAKSNISPWLGLSAGLEVFRDQHTCS